MTWPFMLLAKGGGGAIVAGLLLVAEQLSDGSANACPSTTILDASGSTDTV